MSTDQISTKAESIAAVKQYISLDSEKSQRHLANIIVCVDGKDFCTGVKMISVKADKDSVEIVIEDFHILHAEQSNKFTLENSCFFVHGNTLQIKSINVWGQKTTIEITKI